jgi:N-methylhydantoinase A
MIRAGSDIGGTFTDVIVFDSVAERVTHAKVLTSRAVERAVIDGIQMSGVALTDIDFLVHGSTVVINALIERKGVRTALVTTAGFRDVYEIGRINRPDSFNIFFKKHTPLVERALRFEVRERMLIERELEALDSNEVDALADRLLAAEVDAIAILLLHSYADPRHERELKARLALRLPHCFISASHELTREYREYERTSTVVANAYVGPIVSRYVNELERALARGGWHGHFHLMQSNGGLITAQAAQRDCVALIESGPAGGLIGAREVLRDLGIAAGVAFDMGGTTAKAGVIEHGEPRIAHQYFVGSYMTGLPVLTPVMDIHEVGMGGGSIATVTPFGELRVGPRSAGAAPGPACYGLGGSAATVTDANVVLGRLHAELPLAGNLALDAAAARAALVRDVAAPLGVEAEVAAGGMLKVANTSMAYAISAVTIERGLQPADFALVAYGGAGPLHATQLARELGMRCVIVPPSPGVFSAYGMLFADSQGHAARTAITRVAPDTIGALHAIADELAVEAAARLGLTIDALDAIEYGADMRYVGQEHTVFVAFPREWLSATQAARLKTRFDDVHQRTYSHSAAGEPAELVTLRCVGTRQTPKPAFLRLTPAPPAAPAFEAPVWLNESGADVVPFYARTSLPPAQCITGPAVIFEETASTLLGPGDVARVHRHGHLVIELEEIVV